MEGHRGRMALALKMAMMMISISLMEMEGVRGRDPVLHRVGGGQYKWAPDVNFTQWASHEAFYVGDWLFFGFDKRRYNVLQVNKTSYDTCAHEGFIANITRGGRDVYNLTQAKPYYFLCSRSNGCLQGMKVAISVKEAPFVNPGLLPPRTLPRNNGHNPPSLAHGSGINDPILCATIFLFLSFLIMC